jgi:hypothetical protein
MHESSERDGSFGVVGIGLAACAACCAPLILGFLGGLGMGGLTAWFVVGSAGVVLGLAAGFGVLGYRRWRSAARGECATDGSCGCSPTVEQHLQRDSI